MDSNSKSKKLLQKIKKAPVDPGCYLFRDKTERIIYVGKAKNLKNRVKSYFVKVITKNLKSIHLTSKITDVEFIVTHSEIEALILENTLIKKHRPKYNISLRDDKTFPYVRITSEPFPQVFITRKIIRDGSRYFGPYTDAKPLRSSIRLIKKIFSVRSCRFYLESGVIEKGKIKLCLDYHIRKCEGPCQGLVSEEDYNRMIGKVIAFLHGKTAEVVEFINEKMENASIEMKYEDAAHYRDQINALQNHARRQSVDVADLSDRDLISLVTEEDDGCAVVFCVRQGKLIGKNSFILEGVANHKLPEAMRAFLQQYYSESDQIPPEILVNIFPEDGILLKDWLAESRAGRVLVKSPLKGNKRRLMEMAEKNAKIHLSEFSMSKTQRGDYIPKPIKKLYRDLSLPNLPRRIEAFDVSNIRGKLAVASMVVFVDGKPKKSEYRRFKIKSVTGINDFAMISEVVRRRYKRILKEKKRLPDLILIDGGKGQLSSAKSALNNLKLPEIPAVGLTKRLEELYLPGKSDPIILIRDSISLILLRKIRDEAHRFAIAYHRKLRTISGISSELDNVRGLGIEKRQELWKRFKTISAMRSASIDDFKSVKGIGKKLANSIWIHLHN